jgi:predicted O-methyltransferase YrrM
MKYRKIIISILILACLIVVIDMLRLTDEWRYYGWKIFTKKSSPEWTPAQLGVSETDAMAPPSGFGLFPDSPYTFTHGWHLAHIPEWKRHLKEFKGKPNVHALEIGAYEGLSVIWQLENILTDPSSSITCIDIFMQDGLEEKFDHNIAVSGMANKVIKIKGPSEIMLRDLDIEKFDYIYIDGSHMPKWVLNDAVLSWEILKPGGLIIFDDYRGMFYPEKRFKLTRISFLDNYIWRHWAKTHYTPEIAIDAFLKIYGPYLEVIYKEYQVVVRKKTETPPIYW